jgi:hypothetical protein
MSTNREQGSVQRNRGDAEGGHLYILEVEDGMDWRYWYINKEPPNGWKPLYLKARQVFLRHGWAGQGSWFAAPIPFKLDGVVIAVEEPSGLIYAWSTHELGWLDPTSDTIEP